MGSKLATLADEHHASRHRKSRPARRLQLSDAEAGQDDRRAGSNRRLRRSAWPRWTPTASSRWPTRLSCECLSRTIASPRVFRATRPWPTHRIAIRRDIWCRPCWATERGDCDRVRVFDRSRLRLSDPCPTAHVASSADRHRALRGLESRQFSSVELTSGVSWIAFAAVDERVGAFLASRRRAGARAGGRRRRTPSSEASRSAGSPGCRSR